MKESYLTDLNKLLNACAKNAQCLPPQESYDTTLTTVPTVQLYIQYCTVFTNMSLSCMLLRSFNRSTVTLRHCQKLHTTSLVNTYVSPPRLAVSVGVTETHDQKNARLQRPLSPHMTIYKFPLPAVLSVSHRATGIALTAYAMILSTVGLTGGVDALISSISAWGLPAVLLYLGKTAFALPVTFHSLNGIRHLVWDMGKFLSMKEVYTTGYAVIGLSIVAAMIVAGL